MKTNLFRSWTLSYRHLLILGMVLSFGLLSTSCSPVNYPTPSSSNQAKHLKKSHRKYGKPNGSSIRIKSNYKIKG